MFRQVAFIRLAVLMIPNNRLIAFFQVSAVRRPFFESAYVGAQRLLSSMEYFQVSAQSQQIHNCIVMQLASGKPRWVNSAAHTPHSTSRGRGFVGSIQSVSVLKCNAICCLACSIISVSFCAVSINGCVMTTRLFPCFFASIAPGVNVKPDLIRPSL